MTDLVRSMFTRLLRRVGWLRTRPGAEPPRPWHMPLSSREAEVAELIVAGLSNREIAQRFDLPVRAVEARIIWIMQKLDVTKRSEIAAWVLRNRPS